MGHPKYLSVKDFQDNLQYTYHKIKNNTEYLNFISENARSWFVKNCSANSNVDYIISELDNIMMSVTII
jgi:hypothetical protein